MNNEMIVNRVKEAFTSGPKMVFFVGAGISIPSGVKSFGEFNERDIRSITDEKLRCKEYIILSEEVRPEVMLQIGIHELGPEIIESLEMFIGYKPNSNHFFLAEMLRRGNWVFTTNQENLIEEACRLKEVEFKKCYIDSHFENFEQYLSKPKDIPGGYIFKLHGTIEENKKGKERFDSIRIALEQVGQGLSKHRRKVFKYFLENYDFCFMGYSCQDDFSIYPVLLNMKSDKTVFWFKYAEGEEIKSLTKEEIEEEIKREKEKKPWKGEKRNWEIINVNEFLLRRSKFFKFIGDSNEFVKNLRQSLGINTTTNSIAKEHEDISFAQWCKDLREFERNMFIGRLFEQVGEWGKASQCYERAEKEAKREGNKKEELIVKQRIAGIYYKRTELKKENEAIEIYKECIDIAKKELKDDFAVANLKFDIINVERRLRAYLAEPKKWAEEVKKELKIIENKDVKSYARCLNVVGLAHLRGSEDDIKAGLDHCLKSKKIKEKIGDKDGEAESENAIGLLLIAQGKQLAQQDRILAEEKIKNGIKHLEKAIDIRIKYGFYRGCAQSSRNMGDACRELMNLAQNEEEKYHYFQKAEESYEASIDYLDLFKPRGFIGEVLNWKQRIAGLYRDFSKLISNTKQKKSCISKIISVYEEELNIFGDQEMRREIKHKEKEYKVAKNILEEAKKSCEEIGLPLEMQEIGKILEELERGQCIREGELK